MQHLSRAASATSRRTCTRSRSRPTRTGRRPTPSSPRSATTCGASPTTSASAPHSASTAGHRRRVGRGRGRLAVETTEGAARARPRRRPGAAERALAARVQGLDDFEGETFHSARWNHDYDLPASASPSIGTGASAIQVVPEIQPRGRAAARLPAHRAVGHAAPDRPITGCERASTARFPRAAEARALRRLRARELLVLGFVKQPEADEAHRADRAPPHRSQIPDPELREKVTPDYAIGCKRILLSNKWYPALGKPNVELVTDGVERGRGELDRDRRRRASARSTRSSSAPASTSPTSRSARICAGRGGRRCSPRAGRQPAGLPGHGGRRVPEPLPAARARTPASGTTRWSS